MGGSLIQEEHVLTVYEAKKYKYFSIKIVARLRAGQNILYSIVTTGISKEPIEFIPTLKEMKELGELLVNLSKILTYFNLCEH